VSDSCSAVPADLEAYGAAGLRMDAMLRAQAERLQDALDKLMASHPDPEVLGRVPPVGSNLNHYATTNANTDVWVGDVGKAFEQANRHGSRTEVHTASSRTIDGYLKKEEPQGPQGEEILAKLDPKAHGSIVGNWHSVSDWLVKNKDWLQQGWGFFAMGGSLPLVLSASKRLSGARYYELTLERSWANVRGAGLRNVRDPRFLNRYLWSGRLDRTSLLRGNAEVAKYYRPLTAMRGELGAAFNPRNAEFIKAIPRGGGAATAALTLGGDIYDFTAGSEKKQGLASNRFAATATYDLATAGAGIAASAAASAGTGAIMGATVGSVVPGVGTAVGLAVGVGVTLLANSKWGKEAKGAAVHAMSSGLSTAEHVGGEAVHDVGKAAKSVGHFLGL
jgi:hypothetical protein